MGWSYFRKQQYSDALLHFERMLELDPDHAGAVLGKGTVLYTRGDYQGAIDHYARLMDRVPARSDSWDQWSYMLNNYGWCHYFLGSYTEAAALFQRLGDYHRDLNVIAPLNGLGWCYLKTGDHDKAREAFLRSLWLLPGNYLAQLGMNLLKPEQEAGTGGSPAGPVAAD
jgi:tetratricopeptide (TPR) repeat protein